MTDEQTRLRADERLEQALRETGARDPRDFYRQRLRALKESDDRAFLKAIDYFEKRLVPAVAAEDSDPLAEWLDYGRFLSNLTRAGRTVQIDPTGCAQPYGRPTPADHLVLHLPRSTRHPALAVGLPPSLSPAQRATYKLLVGTSARSR